MFWKKDTSEIPILSNHSSGGFSKYLIGGGVTFLCLFLGFMAWGYVWAQQYSNLIAPNVSLASIDISGKSADEVRTLLQKKIDELITYGIPVQLDAETKTLPLATLIGSDLVEHVNIDIDKTIQSALSVHHHTNSIINVGVLVFGLLRPVSLPVVITLQDRSIKQSIHTLFSAKETPASDTSFIFSSSESGWDIQTREGVKGTEIETKIFLKTLKNQLRWLRSDPIELMLVSKAPTMNAALAETEIPLVKKILQAAPYLFTYKDESGNETNWPLSAHTLSTMLIPLPDGAVGLDKDSFGVFTEKIIGSINRPAKNARFKLNGNRVSEFAQSEDGRVVDEPRLYSEALLTIQTQSTEPILLVVETEQSQVTTGSVNDLGIKDKLGVGTSSYKGSPSNRRKNIQNGVNLLNGLLIAPGDTFSLIDALKPFTKENGYLSELVIKGDQIKPELGGGLCQIGTTIFRATMNSGLTVAERSNHSLVVSYYNDPSNNNPGTDATIYEPAPDFKLTNDTGNYIMIQAENLTDIQQLRFTFWGTSDGRRGSYTPPVVLRRIPAGEQITTETENLEPGVEKCQEAHAGADASFTYFVKHADGSLFEKVFTSHYRPLPKICLVGVDPTKVEEVNVLEMPAISETDSIQN